MLVTALAYDFFPFLRPLIVPRNGQNEDRNLASQMSSKRTLKEPPKVILTAWKKSCRGRGKCCQKKREDRDLHNFAPHKTCQCITAPPRNNIDTLIGRNPTPPWKFQIILSTVVQKIGQFSNAHLTTICNRAWRGLADGDRQLGTSASPLTLLPARMVF